MYCMYVADRTSKSVLVDATSRTTNPSEKNYSSAKLECACVIWIAKKWKHYLLSTHHPVIVTDSYGLQYLQQKNKPFGLDGEMALRDGGFQLLRHIPQRNREHIRLPEQAKRRRCPTSTDEKQGSDPARREPMKKKHNTLTLRSIWKF